jgi:hypothetical protein
MYIYINIQLKKIKSLKFINFNKIYISLLKKKKKYIYKHSLKKKPLLIHLKKKKLFLANKCKSVFKTAVFTNTKIHLYNIFILQCKCLQKKLHFLFLIIIYIFFFYLSEKVNFV